MSFVTVDFLVFFAVVFGVYWCLGRRAQNAWLVLASLVFYGWVHPWFPVLLLISAGLDFGCALAIERWPDRALAFLRLSIAGSLGLLGAFKYFDFFVDNVIAALEAVGVAAHPATLGLILPVGLSFYTLQSLSYTIDVYWGKIPARRNFVDYLVFVAFFPQLVAGPIERAGHMLAQVERDRRFDLSRTASGLGLAVFGACKKVVIADTLAPYVNAVYGVEQPGFVLAWAGAAGFLVQMLADFSGYTDIARGTGRMLGFDLRANFDHPYLATNPRDFWARWHISLSDWLRDYVFFPVFTSKLGRGFVRATVVTFVVSGLWHGAAWHFVLWGLLWAAAHLVHHYAAPHAPAWWNRLWPVHIAAMLLLNLVAHQVFREPSLARLSTYFVPRIGTREELVVATILASFTMAGAGLLVAAMAVERILPLPLPLRTTAIAIAAWGLYIFSRQAQSEFLYFAF